MKTLKICTLILFLLVHNAIGQEEGNTIRNLKIGDTVPDLPITQIINDEKTSSSIAEYKDKLLILDFWDTFCGSCINALAKVDTLQKVFGTQVKMLPVTYQSAEVINTFLIGSKFLGQNKVDLPYAVGDKVLRERFKHRTISHLVWIYKGEVKAITGTALLSKANIQLILDGKQPDWFMKDDDMGYDLNKPIFKIHEGAYKIGQKGAVRGYLPGVLIKTIAIVNNENGTLRTFFVNRDVLGLYLSQWAIIKPHDFVPGPQRIILEVKDPTKYTYNSKEVKDVWNSKHSICYERLDPIGTDKVKIARAVVSDLDSLLGLLGRWEKRMKNCLVISNIDTATDLPKYEGRKIPKKGRELFSIRLSLEFAQINPPVVDETNYKGKTDILKWIDLNDLKAQLLEEGFILKKEPRLIDVFVLTEK